MTAGREREENGKPGVSLAAWLAVLLVVFAGLVIWVLYAKGWMK